MRSYFSDKIASSGIRFKRKKGELESGAGEFEGGKSQRRSYTEGSG
jgi:hypothetical protein